MKEMTNRRSSRSLRVGNRVIGGNAPITVQSMTNTDTHDVAATLMQIRALESAGADIVRLAVPDVEAAATFTALKEAGVGIPLVAWLCKDPRQRGVHLQSAFRSNFALIGIPLATMLFGTEGAAYASLLSAFTIPLFNILAVLALSIFGDGKKKMDWKKILLDMAKNPLILGVLSGFFALLVRALFAWVGIGFRLTDVPLVYKAIENVAKMATPFALIALGGRFKLEAVKRLWKPIVVSTVVRTAVVPALGLGIAYVLFPHFGGQHFAAYIAAFGSPAAVSSAIMAKEMGADDELAGQLVVWTTIVSALTVFLQVVVLRQVGIF